jgi:hypothetical protein
VRSSRNLHYDLSTRDCFESAEAQSFGWTKASFISHSDSVISCAVFEAEEPHSGSQRCPDSWAELGYESSRVVDRSAPGAELSLPQCLDDEGSFAMKPRHSMVLCLFAVVVIAGCASTNVTQRQELVTGQIARPNNIWVYDFAATPADVPADSDIAADSTPQTPEQIATGRQLGAQIAKELVADIQSMGLPAQVAAAGSSPQVGDIVIRGELVSIQQGSEAKRLAIGFGSGASELTTAVEGFQVTPQGLRKLGSGTVESGGSKMPGGAVPAVVAVATGNPVGLIVTSGIKIYGEESGSSKVEGRAKQTADEIADQLKIRFKQQGWIQ